MTENHYTILNCTETASFDEIKSSYQRLVKQHHPDKQNGKVSEFYQQIDQAWNTLRNIDTRKEYDAKLMNNKLELSNVIYSVLTPEELDLDVEHSIYNYNCRCGGVYSVNVDSINEDCIVNCDECSLVIVIKRDK